MFTRLFLELRQAGVPTTIKEYLALLEAMKANVARFDVDDFYYLARAVLVKDERHLDRFDVVFGEVFKGLEKAEGDDDPQREIPEEWLRKLAERFLTPEEMAKLKAMDWNELMETLKKRLEEQRGRHQGGSKWIGTGGTSPFGAYGYNPAGIRVGQKESRHRRAVKVWDKREFRNLDGDVELGTRNIKLALRRLRQFAREGAATELDLEDTIRATANNAGTLDLKLVPERRNAVKVLLFFDIGGSMDDFIRTTEELFTAARYAFKHLEYFYFHNCLYERVWRDNRRRNATSMPTMQVLNTYGSDYRLIFVGDATMSPYEITEPGASVEHWNEESGKVWMGRILRAYPKAVWLNPKAEPFWDYTPSLTLLKTIMGGRMFPLTIQGLDNAMKALSR
jgi:uncharacterized protein with von Willebrand factor type A (vWA) domain